MSGLQCAVAVVLVVIVWEHRPQMNGLLRVMVIQTSRWDRSKVQHIGSVSQQPFGQAAVVVVSVVLVLSVIVVVGGEVIVVIWKPGPQLYGHVFASWHFKQAVAINLKSRHLGSVSQKPF